MFEVLDELKAILPQLGGHNKTLVEMRIASLQKQADEYNKYIDKLAEEDAERRLSYV
jgi:transcription elongation factor Elf1